MLKSLNQLHRFREFLISIKRAYYRRVWGMDIAKTVRFSMSVKFDRTNPRGVHVGEYTYISFDVAILSHDFTRGIYLDTYIGENCFIGARSIIMPGIRIGDGVIVGAGSVVTRDLPDRCIVAGNPAKVIRDNIAMTRYGWKAAADPEEALLVGQERETA